MIDTHDARARGRLPCPAMTTLRRHLRAWYAAQAQPQRDGTFLVRGLPAGTYFLSLERYHGDFGDRPVNKQVEAGTTDVIFDLD